MKIGMMLPIADTDSGVTRRYAEIRDAAPRLERDGFDANWFADHLLFEWEGDRTECLDLVTAASHDYRAGSVA